MSPASTTEKRKRDDDADETNNNNSKFKKLSLSASSVQETTLLEDNDMSDDYQLVSSASSSVQQTSTIACQDENKQFTKLDPAQYNTWTKEDVFSLLLKKNVEGGAGLSSEKVKPLYDAAFDGSSLDNIVTDLLKQKEDSYIVDECKKSFPNISRDTIKSVVNWVDNLLKTRFYHLWTRDYAKVQLCKSIDGGGADLTIDQFNSVQISKTNRTITSSDEECNDKISKWLQSIIFSKVVLDLNVEKARNDQLKKLIEASVAMPFLGKQELNIALQGIENRIMDGKLATDKQKLPVLFFAGSPGIGKTRNAIELVQCLKEITKNESLKSFLATKVEIYLQLGRNGVDFENFSCDIDKNTQNLRDHFQKMMTIRLCYIFDTFFWKRPFDERNWDKITKVSSFGKFLKGILKVKKLTLVVVIDEFQLLSEFKEESKSGLDVVVNIMVAACSELARDDIFFLPIFSGLSRTKIGNAITKSTHPPCPLLPSRVRMSFEDISHFIEYFIATKPEKAKQLGLQKGNWITHMDLRGQISQCQGKVRRVEFLINNLISSPTWEAIKSQQFEEIVELPAKTCDYIMSYFLTEMDVMPTLIIEGDQFTLEHYEECGYFKLIKHGESYKLDPFFPLTLISHNNSIFYNFSKAMSDAIVNGGAYSLKKTNLEKLFATYISAKSNAFRLLNVKTVPFKDFFKGFLPSQKLGESNFWNGSINLDTFSNNIQEISESDDHSHEGVHYIFSKTQNKKGCDRITKFQIEYEDKKFTTEILFQDRGGMEWNMSSSKSQFSSFFACSDVQAEIEKNQILTFTDHPTTILAYCCTKNFQQPLLERMNNTYDTVVGTTKDSHNLSILPCLILGNCEGHAEYSLQTFFGSTIYEALYLFELPPVIDLSCSADWILRLLFNVFKNTQFQALRQCKSLEDLWKLEFINQQDVNLRMTTSKDSTDDRFDFDFW